MKSFLVIASMLILGSCSNESKSVIGKYVFEDELHLLHEKEYDYYYNKFLQSLYGIL